MTNSGEPTVTISMRAGLAEKVLQLVEDDKKRADSDLQECAADALTGPEEFEDYQSALNEKRRIAEVCESLRRALDLG